MIEFIVESFVKERHVGIIVWAFEWSIGIVPEFLLLVFFEQNLLERRQSHSIEHEEWFNS